MEKTRKLVEIVLKAGGCPIVWGPPGIGKTAMAKSIAATFQGDVYAVYLSQIEPSEVHGLPVAEATEHGLIVKFAPPKKIKAALEKSQRALILYDELTCVPPSTAAAALSIITERVIGDTSLPPERIGLLACANPPEQAAGGWVLPPPLANRLVHLQASLDPIVWADSFLTYWNRPPQINCLGGCLDGTIWAKYRALVASFIRGNPSMLLNIPSSETARGLAWPSPRSWDMVSRVLAIDAADKEDGQLINSYSADLIAGAVGEAAMIEFINFIKNLDLPDPAEVLRDPAKFKLPKDSATLRTVLLAITSFVANKKHAAEEASPSDKKKRMAEAVTAWESAWEVLEAVIRQGGPPDIPTIAAGLLARDDHFPAGAEIPDSVNLFLPILQKAGISWRK